MRSALGAGGVFCILLVVAACNEPLNEQPDPARSDPVNKPDVPTISATAFDGHLLSLSEDGSVLAWELKSGKAVPEVAKRFTRKGLVRLNADGEKLWAADGTTLHLWSAKTVAWEKLADFDASKEELVAVVPVGGSPLLVFPSKVIDSVGKRTIKAPKVDRPFGGPPHRILATHGTDTMLWVGTGNGEWGGELLGLDPKTEKWVVTTDLLGYVTGITHSAANEVIVSWSMSHFLARTQVQVHTADGKTKTEHPRLDEKYIQRLAYNPHDKTLYGIESDQLVTVKDGKPTKVVTLKGELFEREPNAIGVAPGILEIIPVGPKTIAVVPKLGEPWLVKDGEVNRLRKP